MKYLYSIIIALMAAISLTSCDKNNDEPLPPAPEKVSRTVLVYMVADNSLGNASLDLDDLKEMISAVADGDLNGGRLLAYWNCTATENEIPPRLFEVKAEGIQELLRYPDDTSIYSVDPDRIRQVMADMKRLAPADDYGLIMWSHANGWLGAPSEAYQDKYRAFGDDRGYHITLPSLAKALEGERFSFIYFDCCLMGNVECIYELRHLAPVIAAAPTELGVYGMPYNLTIPYFFKPTPDVVGAASATFDDYADKGAECQLAVYDTAALDRLATLSRRVMQGATAFPANLLSLQRYVRDGEYCWSYDMKDYYTMLGAPAEWHQALKDVVLWHGTTKYAIGYLRMESYCGLGSHALGKPSDMAYRGYDSLAWWRDVVSYNSLPL